MNGYVAQRGGAERVGSDYATQVAAAARTAARAERQRLARDLHDSVTQTLIGLHLTATAAAEQWDTQPAQARAALDTLRQLATAATTELRALLLDLHDAVLEQRGLVAALEAHCSIVRQRSGLDVDLHVAAGAGARLPAAHEAALYCIAREALTNVIKHARATHATVTLVPGTTARLTVEDDGVGFVAPSAAFSYGLAGMRERVVALGGRLRLEDRPGGGARVVAELPLPVVPDR